MLVDSAIRAPVEFNLNMVNRLLNSGVTEVRGRQLLRIIEAAASSERASSNTRDFARSFIAYWRKQGAAEI